MIHASDKLDSQFVWLIWVNSFRFLSQSEGIAARLMENTPERRDASHDIRYRSQLPAGCTDK